MAAAQPSVGEVPQPKRFGIITDIQYAERDDPKRQYRQVLNVVEEAVDYLNDHGPLSFVAHLGDIVDDWNSRPATGWMKDRDVDETKEALTAVMRRLNKLECRDRFYLIGNHEMYNWSRGDLTSGVATDYGTFCCADSSGSTYYSFKPWPGWRFVVLDPYEVSIHSRGRGQGLDFESILLVSQYNPNVRAKLETVGADGRSGLEQALEEERIRCGYFDDLEPSVYRRYCPFNGGLSDAQVAWLGDELAEAHRGAERVVLLCHVVFHPGATLSPRSSPVNCFGKTLLWNYEEVLELLRGDNGRCVVACLHGHQHEGGFHTDDDGIHHIVFESPLLGPAFYTVELGEDSLTVEGRGLGPLSLVLPCSEAEASQGGPVQRSLPLREVVL